MENYRKYGKSPYDVFVIHGGPGASGEMAPVAKKLQKSFGVVEPFQTKSSITGQIEELRKVIETTGDSPINLIGWSWGAWLSFLLTAKYPKLVKKLFLVSSGPFESKYAKNIMATRFSRFSKNDMKMFNELNSKLDSSTNSEAFIQIGRIISKSDSFKSIAHKDESLSVDFNIYNKVWKEASKLRESGELLKTGKLIKCPVISIHGDYDPHPAEGVSKPLKKVLKKFKFILLKNCGHHPWYEKEAKDSFYKILQKELSSENYKYLLCK